MENNYEQLYKEAIERARRIKNGEDNWRYSDLTEIIPALEEVLPELADSEDEKIRKELINQIEKSRHHPADKARWLAYLEKQKENPKSADSIPPDCTSDVRCENRWHKVTDSLPDNGRLVLAKDCLGNVLLARYDGENWEVNVYDNEDHYCHNSISKWCEIPSEKQKEQKPAGIPPYVTGIKGDPDPAGVWKPSEEQMEAFKKYIEEFHARAEAAVGGWNNFDVMIRLYEQLKKL